MSNSFIETLPKHPKAIFVTVLRISFGLSLLLVGVSNYQGITGAVEISSSSLGFLSFLGTIWAYIFPALMIVGGALLIVRKRLDIAIWCTVISIAAIPAGVLLKPVISNSPAMLGQVMPMAINAMVWLLILGFIVHLDEHTHSH